MLRGIASANISGGSAITGTTITATTAFNVGDNTVWLTKYAAKQLMISGDGVGASTNMGMILGYYGSSGYSAIWSSSVTPTGTNYAMLMDAGSTVFLNGGPAGALHFRFANADRMVMQATAGAGPAITAGTTTANTNYALSITQGWTNAVASNKAILLNVTTNGGTGNLLELQATGNTAFSVSSVGVLTLGNSTVSTITPGAFNGEMGFGGSTANSGQAMYLDGNTPNLKGQSDFVYAWTASATDPTGSPDSGISRISAGVIGVGTGAAGSFAGRVKLTSTIVAAVAVSALNASPTVGEIQTVNDALAVTVKGATVAAGGSAVCQVMWDGSNWVGI